MTKRFEARESVGYLETWTVGANGAPVDIADWSFTATFQKQAGLPLFTLGMGGSPTAQGFWVIDGASGLLGVRILPATLQGIADTTGDFLIFGDLLGTPPGSPQKFLKALECRVTTAGPWPE